MKKRSMLAVASLAAGVVTSLLTPSSHAAVSDNLPQPSSVLGADDVATLMDDVAGGAAQDAVSHVGGKTAQH